MRQNLSPSKPFPKNKRTGKKQKRYQLADQLLFLKNINKKKLNIKRK
jgi:hypothetical protein